MLSAPPSLPGTWWAYPNVAGSGSARLSLPAGERPIAAAFGHVASVTIGADLGPGTPIPLTLHVREIASGRQAAGCECPEGCDIGVALGRDALFFLGYRDVPAAGLYALSLVDSSVTALIENDGSRRGALVLSPSGRTLALLAVVPEWRASVVDVASRSVSHFSIDSVPFAVSDDMLFTRSPYLGAYDIADGRLLWTQPDTLVVRGYVTGDGQQLVAQTGLDPTETGIDGVALDPRAIRPAITVFDSTSGAARTVGSWDLAVAPTLWVSASTDSAAALVQRGRDGAPTDLSGPISFLNLDSGAITAGAAAGV